MSYLFAFPGLGEWLVAIPFILIPLLIVPGIFYLITLQTTLEVISAENRKMPPSNVWLLLIPIFGVVWQFIVVANIADSIKEEATLRMIKTEPRPGYNIGLAMCILNCFFIFPGLNFLTGLASLICWIVYWLKISDYKKQLLRANNLK